MKWIFKLTNLATYNTFKDIMKLLLIIFFIGGFVNSFYWILAAASYIAVDMLNDKK